MRDELYRRMRAVACRYWSVAPPVLDEMIKDGKLSMSDVFDLCTLLTHDPMCGPWLFSFLYPQIIQKREERQRKEHKRAMFGRLLNFLTPKNDAEARFLERLKQEVEKPHGP